MAGIISNVTGDIQRLRELKAAIEDVKKSLKGIDIRVNIDIKESAEAQLKALSEQYTALVMKIAEAEGKIKLSVHNINKASDAIIQAQEKILKVTGIATQQPSTVIPSNTSAETANVQAQAKAYEDLRTEINAVLGTREANIKRMLDEKKAIDLINAEINKITKSQGEYGNLSSSQQKRLEQLNNSLLTHKTALAEVRQVLSNNVKMDNAAATSMNELSQSLSRMRIVYRELTEEERKSPFGKELISSIQQADAKIKELDSSIGNHARNVGNYKKEWNGLQYQMQMVARELPNFAINPQIGIMSLTNNIPYLVDELKKAKDAHKAYVSEVKAGNKDLNAVPSVGKQVLSSLLNWQTAIVMGITLITAYRKEITEWVGGLFNAKDAVKELLSVEQEMALARKKAISDSTKERTELDLLYNKLKSTTILTQERNAAISEWIKKYPQHANIMDGELINLGKLGSAYQSLSKQIVESAKARAYADKITELEIKRYDSNFKRLNQQNTLKVAEEEYLKTKEVYDKLQNEYDKGKSVGQSLSVARVPYMNAKEEYEKQRKIYDGLEKQTNDYVSKIGHLTEQIKVDDLFPQPKEGTYDYWQQQVQNADIALKQIDSKQRKLLNACLTEGISQNVIDQYKQAIKLKSEAEKELKVYDSSSKQESAADKLRKQQESIREAKEKYNLLTNKQALDQSRSAEDLQTQTDQARINAMHDGNARTLEQMKIGHSKEMQQLDRQQEDLLRKRIEDERSKFDAREDENAATIKDYKKKTFDGSKITLSKPEKDSYDNQKMYLGIKQNSETQAFLDKERQSWNEYLAEYGTFQEKKEAITAEYNEKISNASTKGEKESLKNELENRIKEINLDELKASINFADIFGNLDAQSTEALTLMRDKLKEVIEKSAKDLKPTDLKALQDAFKEIDFKVADRNPFGELKQGIDDYKESTQAVIKAQEDLNTVHQGGEIIVGTYIDSTGKICTKLLTQEQAERNLSDAQRSRLEAQSKLTKSVNSIGQQGQQIVKAGNDLTNMLTDLGVSIPDSVKGTLDGVGQVMDSMASIDLMKPMSILTGITGTLAGIGKTIGSIFGLGGASDGTKVYEEMKEQLSEINEIYEKIIANSKEDIVFGGGFASVRAANDALDTYYKKVENYRRLADAAGGAGSGTFKHSYAHRTNESLSGDWKNISNLVGQNVSGIQDMYNLTGDQLYLIQTKMPDAWNKISGDIRENLNAIIDCKDEVNELAEALNTAMTGIDTDSFYNGFIDQLSDMDTSFEDMCDNFEGYMRKSIIAGLVASQYQDRINGLYQDWSNYAKSGNEITEEEAKDLQERYKGLVEEMMNDREERAKVYGWESSESSSQNSTQKGFEAMSQDTGNELNGRFTALQIAGEEIRAQNTIQSQSLNLLTMKSEDILRVNTEVRNIADETRTILANSYLELQEIRENTGAIVKPIQQMQKDMAEVKKNTSKL